MALNQDNRVIHRFIQDISAYESGGEFYSQIIPLDTQAYAVYPSKEGNRFFYVIGDGEHTYTELRDGLGTSEVYREYPVFTDENLHNINNGLEEEAEARREADELLQTHINEEAQERERFDNLLDEAISEEIENRTAAVTNVSDQLSSHIEDKNNPHEVTKAQVGLGNVDNTSDLNKPISIATQSALDEKQNSLTEPQLEAVNSGVTSSVVAQVETNQSDISTINSKIPAQASASNQLTDRNFVNSSIATNTANFIGTFNSLEELEEYQGTVTNNDYAFVIDEDEQGNVVYDRYKYTIATDPASWEYEFSLNNSSFTASQWAAINSGATEETVNQISTNRNDIEAINNSAPMTSGITSAKVSSYDSHIADTNIHVTAAEKQQWSGKQDVLTAGSNIQINGNVISATDTTYIAGEGISIENGVISNTQTSAEWGNITGTLSDQEDLQSELNCKLTQYSQMPVASDENANQIVQYTGQTTSNYTNGYFYKNNSQTITENWVNFEPSSEEYEIEVNVSIEDFEALLTEKCEGRPFTAQDITHGGIGYYSADRLSFSGDTDDGQFFYMTMTLAEFEQAGVTFNPEIGPRQGVRFTCAIDKQTTTYSWQQIDVQPNSGSSEASWGNISGNLSDQADLQAALNDKQDVINDLDDIRTGASLGETALQSGDNISELVNDAGFTSNVGTVTSVNNVDPVDGNVVLTTSDIGIEEYTANEIQTLWDSI